MPLEFDEDGLGGSWWSASRGSAGRRSRATGARPRCPAAPTVLRNRWGTAPGLWLEGAPGPGHHAARRAGGDAAAAGARGGAPAGRARRRRRGPLARRADHRHSRVDPRRAHGRRSSARSRRSRWPTCPGSTAWISGSAPGGCRPRRRTRRLAEAADAAARARRAIASTARARRTSPRWCSTRRGRRGASDRHRRVLHRRPRRRQAHRDPRELGCVSRRRRLLRRRAQDRAARGGSRADRAPRRGQRGGRAGDGAGRRRAAGGDVAVSVTGIAGPGGGSEQKPVGTVWFGVAVDGGASRRGMSLFAGTRREIRARAAQAALFLLLRRLRAGLAWRGPATSECPAIGHAVCGYVSVGSRDLTRCK